MIGKKVFDLEPEEWDFPRFIEDKHNSSKHLISDWEGVVARRYELLRELFSSKPGLRDHLERDYSATDLGSFNVCDCIDEGSWFARVEHVLVCRYLVNSLPDNVQFYLKHEYIFLTNFIDTPWFKLKEEHRAYWVKLSMHWSFYTFNRRLNFPVMISLGWSDVQIKRYLEPLRDLMRQILIEIDESEYFKKVYPDKRSLMDGIGDQLIKSTGGRCKSLFKDDLSILGRYRLRRLFGSSSEAMDYWSGCDGASFCKDKNRFRLQELARNSIKILADFLEEEPYLDSKFIDYCRRNPLG